MALIRLALLGLACLPYHVVARCPTPLVPHTWQGEKYGCKCYYDDACWPKDALWAKLNATVDGNLLLNVPPEAACHDKFDGSLGSISTYDQAACDTVQSSYLEEQWNVDQEAMLMWKYFTNSTCLPSDDPSSSCTLGYYGVYIIDAQTKHHVKAGVDFARRHNLRFLVRNTGHDFIGRSTGWGGLIIRTHSFQDIDWIEKYDGPGNYHGTAVVFGAGVQGRDTLTKGHMLDQPQMFLTGECPTVGVVGGLLQGGGHGRWTTLKGMAADNALSFDVVTADGEFRTANEGENSDLFWALKGGGPGTFAVVLSATIKTWDDVPSAGGYLFINSTHTQDLDVFWEGFRIFNDHSNHFVDNGMYVYFELGSLLLRVVPFVAIDKSKAELDAITAPLRQALNNSNIPFEYTSKQYSTFFDLYIDLFEDEEPKMSLTGGWVFTQEDVQDNNDEIVESFRTAINPRGDLTGQGFIIGHYWNAGYNVPRANNPTHPAFRHSTSAIITTLGIAGNASLETKADLQNLLTHTIDDGLRKAGPNGCAYVNEADPFQPDWQDHFWGENYDRLLKLKHKWDPRGLFWAVSTPGSEDWEVIETGTRLCKKL